jgi:hypothetical protein
MPPTIVQRWMMAPWKDSSSNALIVTPMPSERKPNYPQPEKNGEFGKFTNFMRRLVAVPHSEIKAQLDAEKKKRASKRRASSGHASRVKG